MPKKYNNKSPYFRDWTTKKLKGEAISYDYFVNHIECYGSGDLQNYTGIMNELEKRGIEYAFPLRFF